VIGRAPPDVSIQERPMADLSAFPITERWPAADPAKIQLYSTPTPNGVKVSIALEELGLAYEPHFINIGANETWGPEFLSLNPNGKIPAMIDPNGPGGKPLGLFESGAILIYLAEKTGKLLPKDAAKRIETIQWVVFQMAAIGPMFGQLGFFHKFAGKEIEDPRPKERYRAEVERLLKVLEDRLSTRKWIMGDAYTIADIAIVGWIKTLTTFYMAGDITGYEKLKHVPRWYADMMARPAVAKGVDIPKRPA
jgi:GSH-dependent disulfide-bond oxidoreductase